MNTSNVHHDGGSNGSPLAQARDPGGVGLFGKAYLDSTTETRKIVTQTIKIEQNRKSNETTAFPIKALLKTTLAKFKQVDPTFTLLPTDVNSTAGALTMASDIPSNATNLKTYFTDFKETHGRNNKKVVQVFIRIGSSLSLWEMKKDNGLYKWLMDEQLYFKTYGFTTTYNTVSAGFISNLHLGLHRRDSVNDVLQKVFKDEAPDVEIRLVPNSIKHGKETAKRVTNVVEIQTNKATVQATRELIIKAFKMCENELPPGTFFVPSPTNGTISYDLYYKLLGAHHEFTANIRSFAIKNIGDIDAMLPTTNPDGSISPTKFSSLILQQMMPDGKTRVFSSIETTKDSERDGKYLFLTNTDNIKYAEKRIDDILHRLTQFPEEMAKVCLNNTAVCRANRIHTSQRFDEHAAFLHSKIPTMITTNPAENAWKRRQTRAPDMTSDEFPSLAKKTRTEPWSNGETETTDEVTGTESISDVDLDAELEKLRTTMQQEFDSKLAQMKDEIKREFGQTMTQMEGRIRTEFVNHMADLKEHANKQTMDMQQNHQSILEAIRVQMNRLGLPPASEQDDSTRKESTAKRHHPNSDPMQMETAHESQNLGASRVSQTSHVDQMDTTAGGHR